MKASLYIFHSFAELRVKSEGIAARTADQLRRLSGMDGKRSSGELIFIPPAPNHARWHRAQLTLSPREARVGQKSRCVTTMISVPFSSELLIGFETTHSTSKYVIPPAVQRRLELQINKVSFSKVITGQYFNKRPPPPSAASSRPVTGRFSSFFVGVGYNDH